jgi:glycerate 2-kinase
MARGARSLAEEVFRASLKAVDPYESSMQYTDKIRLAYKNGGFAGLLVIGFGKAACRMASALADTLEDLSVTGIVITKYGHCGQAIEGEVRVVEAGHPVPDENGLNGTKEITRLLKSADEKTLVTCLISGGGSALLVSPRDGITLSEKQSITELLLKAGADINELNTVRKHISEVKGGRLAEIAYPAATISLILSDVIGDRLDVIASGPTAPDRTTYHDALLVLRKYALIDKAPASISEFLSKGANRLIPETPKEGNPIFERVENIIIGNNRKATGAARTAAAALGLRTEILSSEISGEARDAGKWLAKKAKELRNSSAGQGFSPALCLISGGETTVTVKGNGLGGRNMELALSFAIEIEGMEGVTLLSAGTDGTDGPTDSAGAVVDGSTVAGAKALGLDPAEYLSNNDSYGFFRKTGELLFTGPTGTNVMDLQIMVLE